MENKTSNWIWLRGLAREKGHWYDFKDEFVKHFDGVQVEVLDIPGNGSRFNEKSPMSISAMTDAIRDSSQLIKQGEKPFLLSISMGSMIAMDWAYRYSEEVKGVVCINTSLREQSRFWSRLKPGNYWGLLKSLAQKERYQRELEILKMTTHRRSDLMEVAESYAQLAEKHPVSRSNFLRQLTAAGTFTTPQQKAKRPFLFLNSLRDDFVDPKCTEMAAAHVGGDFFSHPTAGHDLPLDDGVWVAERLREWVESLENGQ